MRISCSEIYSIICQKEDSMPTFKESKLEHYGLD